MNRSAVDVSGGGGAVYFRVSGWDNGGLASVAVNVSGPEDLWQSVELEEASEYEWSGATLFPEGTPVGVYRVGSIELRDSAGNETVVDSGELKAEGYPNEISIYDGPDTDPPSLESFEVTPAAVDTSLGPVNISAGGEVKDDQSGVKAMEVSVQLPNHAPPYTYTISQRARLQSGTQDSGVQRAQFEIPNWAYPGTYQITEVRLEDNAGNVLKLDGSELEADGFPVQFEVTGLGDTTPPEILSFSISPLTIPADGGTVKAFIRVRDDLAGFAEFPNDGFSQVYLSFDWPPHSGPTSTTGHVPVLVSGGPLDGTWMIETTFAADAPSGEYPVSYLGAYDRAANNVLFDRSELEAKGWGLSFTKLP